MILFNVLKRALVKEALNSIDVTKPIPVAKVGKSAPIVKPKKRTVISDVIENPENFILEAWVDRNEINVRVKRRYECETVDNVIEESEVSE